MDRRQALKCAIGAAAGVALGGVPAAASGPGLLSGSSVLADAALQLPIARQIPVSIIEIRLTPDGHLCTSWRFVRSTLESEGGDGMAIKLHDEDAIDSSKSGAGRYSRAIVDKNGNLDHIIIARVPENYVVNIGEDGQVTLDCADGCDVFGGGKPISTAFTIRCPSSQREGSAS